MEEIFEDFKKVDIAQECVACYKDVFQLSRNTLQGVIDYSRDKQMTAEELSGLVHQEHIKAFYVGLEFRSTQFWKYLYEIYEEAPIELKDAYAKLMKAVVDKGIVDDMLISDALGAQLKRAQEQENVKKDE